MMMVPTKILPLLTTGLLGWKTKFRMGMELLRAPRPKPGDESVAEFIQEHYGAEAVDYLAEPLLSGIYGGNPSQLSVTSVLPRFVELANQYGSLTRGVLAARAKAGRGTGTPAPLFRTLKGGLGQLVDAIADAISGKVEVRQCRAQTIQRAEAGFRIKLDDGGWLEAGPGGGGLRGAQRLGPAGRRGRAPGGTARHGALQFLDDRGAGLRRRRFRARPPMVSVSWCPRRSAAGWWRAPGWAPSSRTACRRAKWWRAASWAAWRTPACSANRTKPWPPLVASELQEIAGFTARPRFTRIARWPRSMAQYTVGHPQRLAEIQARTPPAGGLHLAGNAYEGIGIPDCIRNPCLGAGLLVGFRGIRLRSGPHEPVGRAFVNCGLVELARRFHLCLGGGNAGVDARIGPA